MSLGSFTPVARRAVVRAGIAALDAGHPRLGTDSLLLGLAAVSGASPVLQARGVTPAAIRAEIDQPAGVDARRDDRALLATLGIDLDEVRRRSAVRPDDPHLWQLRRSPVRPLRVTLAGPSGSLVLTGHGRQAFEVACWAAGRGTPVTGEHLLWGLLADASNTSRRILCHLGVDIRAVWRGVEDATRGVTATA